VILLLLLACAGSLTPAPSAVRLVSLSPGITETLGAIDALDTLVGRSDWCHAPPAVDALPAVGSGLTPDLERITALRPSTILLDGSVGNQTDTLRGLAQVEVLPWLTADELVSSTIRLGALTHHEPAANALAKQLQTALLQPAPAQGPAVLLALGGEPGNDLWFIKQNSLHGSALHAAGGRNAVDHDVAGAPTLSTEALVTLDPPYVIVLLATAPDAAKREATLADWSRLRTLRAVRDGHIGVLGGPLLLSPGPAILDTIRQLHEELARLGALP
jgi:ABC-type Fe3+-hydroxamate transport system substrate-binding protein